MSAAKKTRRRGTAKVSTASSITWQEMRERDLTNMRSRGITDDGMAFILSMEAKKLTQAAAKLVPLPVDPALSQERINLALAVVDRANRIFETGEEVPNPTDKAGAILREALRSAKGDIHALMAASRQLDTPEALAYSAMQAEDRIALALALHEYYVAAAADDLAAMVVNSVGARVEREANAVQTRALKVKS